MVQFVELVPVGLEELGVVLDPLALQGPSPGQHLLPPGQGSFHRALQLVYAALHLLEEVVVVLNDMEIRSH